MEMLSLYEVSKQARIPLKYLIWGLIQNHLIEEKNGYLFPTLLGIVEYGIEIQSIQGEPAIRIPWPNLPLKRLIVISGHGNGSKR